MSEHRIQKLSLFQLNAWVTKIFKNEGCGSKLYCTCVFWHQTLSVKNIILGKHKKIWPVLECCASSHKQHSTMKNNTNVNKSKAAFGEKMQTKQWCTLERSAFVVLLCLPCHVCQGRKFHLLKKCKCWKAQGRPPKENNSHRPAEEQTLPLNLLKRH